MLDDSIGHFLRVYPNYTLDRVLSELSLAQFAFLLKASVDAERDLKIGEINTQYVIAIAAASGNKGPTMIRNLINRLRRTAGDSISADELLRRMEEKQDGPK